MACKSQLFGIHYEHHDWRRSFVGTETGRLTEHDIWGRSVETQHVICQTRMVCARCGEKGDSVECICDKSKGDRCAFRLEGMLNAGEAAHV